MITQKLSKSRIREETYFVDETGAQYSYIAGGFTWPTHKPGFGCVVGVVRISDPEAKPRIKVLAEVEDRTPRGLNMQCLDLQARYEAKNALRYWLGDQKEAMIVAVHQVNADRRKAKKPCFNVAPSADLDAAGGFRSSIYEIKTLLQEQRLVLGDCDKLRTAIINAPGDTAAKDSPADYPALAALGYVISSFAYKPWRAHDKKTPFGDRIEGLQQGGLDEDERYAYKDQQSDPWDRAMKGEK